MTAGRSATFKDRTLQPKTGHLPALWLAAMATEESQHHQQSEGSSWPMETRVTVAMVKEAIQPLFLWKHIKTP